MEFLKRTISFVLAVVMLLLSTSFTYYKSFCEEGCSTEISLVKDSHDCCSEDVSQEDTCHEEELKEDDCCGVDPITIKYDGKYDSFKEDDISFEQIVSIEESFFIEFNFDVLSQEKTSISYRGPPDIWDSGRDVLLKKSVLVI